MKQTIKKYMEDAPKSDSSTHTSDDESKLKRKGRMGNLFHVASSRTIPDVLKDPPRKSFLQKQSSMGNFKTLQPSGSSLSLPKSLVSSLSTGEPMRTFYIVLTLSEKRLVLSGEVETRSGLVRGKLKKDLEAFKKKTRSLFATKKEEDYALQENESVSPQVCIRSNFLIVDYSSTRKPKPTGYKYSRKHGTIKRYSIKKFK